MEPTSTIEEKSANAVEADQSKAGSPTESSSPIENTGSKPAAPEVATVTNAGDDEWTIDAPNETDIESDQASHAQASGDADTSTSTIAIAFVDFGFQPIEGLKYKFKAGDKTITGVTDAEGKADSLTDITPGVEVEIHVFRDHTKDYKQVGVLLAHPGWVGYTIVSPKIKFDVETEVHVGAPGEAEKNLPPVPPKADSTPAQASSAAITAPTSTAGTMSNTSTTSSKNTSSSAPPAEAKPPSAQAKPPTPAQPKKPDVASDRDARGNPQATVQDSAVDWLKRKILAVYNFWSWKDFQKPQPVPPTASKQPASSPSAADKKVNASIKQAKDSAKRGATSTPQEPPQGHPKVNAPTAPALGRKLSEAELERLNRLVEFAEHQITLSYKEYKDRAPTAQVLAEYAKLASPSFPSKPVDKPLGMCQVYVKIALFKTGYTNGPGNEKQAKTAGKDWLAYGFVEISNQLPQIEVTYESAMAAKDMPKANEILGQRTALAALKNRRIKEKKPMSSEEISSIEKGIPALPDITTAKYIQPDLMYTVPGDVIVYEQVDPVEYDPAGHVDIRTYHGFVSDFVWRSIPSLGGKHRTTKRYKVIGIYRKISDTLAMARVQAFLKVLRSKETTGYTDADSYFVLPDTRDSNKKYMKRKFTDTSTHPFSDAATEKFSNIDYYGNVNTSAGAYQTKLKTWAGVLKDTGWPSDYTASMQDRIALYLLQSRQAKSNGVGRTALGYIMEGKIEAAINETQLWNEWACLPRGVDSAYTMDQLKADYERYLGELLK